MTTSISELVTSNKIISNKLTSLEIRVRVLELGGDLLSVEYPNDMTGWYCLCYKKLGEVKFGILCSMARQGRKPKLLFGWLLKENMSKI